MAIDIITLEEFRNVCKGHTFDTLAGMAMYVSDAPELRAAAETFYEAKQVLEDHLQKVGFTLA